MVSFPDLYERRADYLYFLCTRLEGIESKVDHLFQDVWRRIHRQLPQLSTNSEEIWLCSKLVDSHRLLHRRGRAESPDLKGTSDEARLTQIVTSLPLEHRWPLVLRECAGFNYSDLSEILNIPEGTVRARIARARAIIQKYGSLEA